MKQVFPYHVDTVGGASAHDYAAEKTYQFLDIASDRQIATNAVSGLLIVGDFDYQIGVSHGSQPMGKFRTVTQSDSVTIYKIDHQPALDWVRTLLGDNRLHDFEQMINSISFGVPFADQDYSEDLLLRVISGFDPEVGSIQVSNPMPVGTEFQIVRRNPDRVLQATQTMAKAVLDQIKNPDQALYFYFNCDGRGAYLFGEPEPAEKMSALGNLVAGVAHEINNPLGFLNGSVKNAKDYTQDLLEHLALYQHHYPEAAKPIQEIEVNSALGKGSEFVIRLPLHLSQ